MGRFPPEGNLSVVKYYLEIVTPRFDMSHKRDRKEPMFKQCSKEACISGILRVAFVVMFGNAALAKFMMGFGTSAQGIMGMFKATWLPVPLVTAYAYALPFVEALIALWLLSGIRLKEAWTLTALTLISLGFGLMVAQNPTVAGIYTYILMACAGLYFSDFDECNIMSCCKK